MHFKPISEALQSSPDQTISICGILNNVPEPVDLVSERTGKSLRKIELDLFDEDLKTITLTLWNDDIDKVLKKASSVVTLARVCTKIYDGRISLVYTDDSLSAIQFDTGSARSRELQAWWKTRQKSGPPSTQSAPSSAEKQLNFAAMQSQIRSPIQARDGAPLKFSNEVTITKLHPLNVFYKACSTTNCAKKVEITVDNQWYCSKCNQARQSFEWRFALKFSAQDETQELSMTAFETVSKKLSFYSKYCTFLRRKMLGLGKRSNARPDFRQPRRSSRPGVHNTRPAGRMRPARPFCAARRAVPAFPLRVRLRNVKSCRISRNKS